MKHATSISGSWVAHQRDIPLRHHARPRVCGAPGSEQQVLAKGVPALEHLGDTSNWHDFGMEWKEHIAWTAPMLATAAAFLVLYYGRNLVTDKRLRTLVIVLFIGAFVTAAIAGLFGALITKAAPVR